MGKEEGDLAIRTEALIQGIASTKELPHHQALVNTQISPIVSISPKVWALLTISVSEGPATKTIEDANTSMYLARNTPPLHLLGDRYSGFPLVSLKKASFT